MGYTIYTHTITATGRLSSHNDERDVHDHERWEQFLLEAKQWGERMEREFGDLLTLDWGKGS